ncbi:MAG: SpoIIE family protein phosphatase [Bacteroidaceae bacterium]|nr:SpoIIE family protein phosphatase [Bacteroidaceae bacterium]
MNIIKKLRPESLRSKSTLAIIITVAVLIEVISAVQYWYAREGIKEAVRHRAESELQVKNLEIQKVMVNVQTAVQNSTWLFEKTLSEPDSICSVLQHLVKQNQSIVGAALIFTADYYPQYGRWFEPYVAKHPDGTMEYKQIGSADHDYLNAEFYLNGLKAGNGYWSEPYYDDSGAKMMLSSYLFPIHDASGQTVALIGADVSLEWLADVINANHIYPSSFNFLLSRLGQVMACPVDTLIMQGNINEITASVHDTTVRQINRQMLGGNRGYNSIRDNAGKKHYVFYAPVEGTNGWSMAVVCSDDEIYRGLRQVGFNLMLLMLIGLALLCYIIYRVARSVRSLQEANAVKERIGSELRIARDIQDSMLPKTFPPFPQRKDIDVFASITPAKEVGGDLYDFFIRDNQFFFCIGDVAGKGVPASLVMAVTRSLFRSVASNHDQPADIVRNINESMTDMNKSEMFVTLFVGVLDLQSGLMHYCNAGHEPPLLVGRGIGHLPVEHNIPVGLMAGWDYIGQEAVIYPLTTIFLYTDGLTEAEDSTHAQFGQQRMAEMARQAVLIDSKTETKSEPDSVIYKSEELVNFMSDAVSRFVGDAEQSDDLTMLAIRYAPHSVT